MLSEEDYVNFLIEHGLTQPQFLFLYLNYRNRKDLIEKYKKVFPSNDNTFLGSYFLEDLVIKKFITKEEKDNKFQYYLTDKFKLLMVENDNAATEIWTLYPDFITINNVEFPAKSYDIDKFITLYGSIIKNSKKEHIEIKKDIKYAIEHKNITMGIEKFFKGRVYLAYRNKRKEDIIFNDKDNIIHGTSDF